MYPENTFQAEISYRANRIRNGVSGKHTRRTRVPFVRRPAEASDTSR